MVTRRRLLATASLLPVAASPAGAQQRLPDGPVSLIVPYTPGTGHDILARLLSPYLSGKLGQAVVVDNRAGASGNIGSQAVARAAPDGRMLMMQGDAFVINPSLFQQVPYDPVGSFAPIIRLTTAELALAVQPDFPARDVRGVVEYARAHPGRVDYASPGNGTPQHLSMALFALTAGLELNHVPYRGSAPAVQDLIGRRVGMMFLPVHTALPLAQAGQIRMLAVGGERRAAAAPDLPTIAEAGLAMPPVGLWYGLLGPAGLPGELVSRLNADCNAWLAEPATRTALQAQGMTAGGGTPEAFAELIGTDLRRWERVIREAKINAG
ncbi:Bug family tripartite tricarboxylate transporter substrate binding protein [Pararoseomonas indoligenes]|uniref:Tripartite tricarboxylate transporter substrate binding protein n=1 Tax=Roseomonas indoligenes TaxID=2820811 RepID=A0A940MXD8_9PROT|nr:tripartite tricarboxylate transporter substrate binding protein [Pararoseomonas indoligenes]MBP0493851.1 tripartite tricarboxylate transporter substrate binding protein [Pararoseomonas indoligenes]